MEVISEFFDCRSIAWAAIGLGDPEVHRPFFVGVAIFLTFLGVAGSSVDAVGARSLQEDGHADFSECGDGLVLSWLGE